MSAGAYFASRKFVSMFHTLIVFGTRPLIKELRDGEQWATCACALSKNRALNL